MNHVSPPFQILRAPNIPLEKLLMANRKNVMAMLFLTTIVAVAATRPAETYGVAEENTLKMATPSSKGVDATLAATRVVAAEKSIKKAETATRPKEAAKKDAAKSEADAMKYGAISQQAAGKNGA